MFIFIFRCNYIVNIMHKQIFILPVEEKSKFKSQNILSDSTTQAFKRIGQIVFIKNSITY